MSNASSIGRILTRAQVSGRSVRGRSVKVRQSTETACVVSADFENEIVAAHTFLATSYVVGPITPGKALSSYARFQFTVGARKQAATPVKRTHSPTAAAASKAGPEDALVARRVSKGNAEDQSRRLLRDVLERHKGANLVNALVYNNFATEKAAAAFVAAREGKPVTTPKPAPVAPDPDRIEHAHGFSLGDTIVARDGDGVRGPKMTVWRIDPPGLGGNAHWRGPTVWAHVRPGGYGVTLDGETAAKYLVCSAEGSVFPKGVKDALDALDHGGEPGSAAAKPAVDIGAQVNARMDAVAEEIAAHKRPSGFAAWLDTFVSEKGIDTDHIFTVPGPRWGDNMIPVSVVIEAAKNTGDREQRAIKDTLVKIDFRNGDVMHYFEHLAKALAQNNG